MSDTEVLDYERDGRSDERDDRSDRSDSNRPDAPAKKMIDHQGLQAPQESEIQSEIVYDINEEPSFHITRALFIANLRRPIDAVNFQNYLKQLASEGGDFHVERAWLNRTRTHGIVLIDHEEGAVYIRNKLLGSIYPSPEEDLKLKEEYEAKEEERFEAESKIYNDHQQAENDQEQDQEREPVPEPVAPRKFEPERLPLYVDFIPVKAINQWVFEEDKGPKNGIWKIDYETRGEDVIANHTLLNGDFIPRFNPHRGRGRGRGYRGGYRGRGGHYPPSYDNPNGPRPYNVFPPRNNYRGDRYNSYHPYRSRERDSYVPGRSERDSYTPGRHERDSYGPGRNSERSARTDTYQPNYDRSRSPSRETRRSP